MSAVVCNLEGGKMNLVIVPGKSVSIDMWEQDDASGIYTIWTGTSFTLHFLQGTIENPTPGATVIDLSGRITITASDPQGQIPGTNVIYNITLTNLDTAQFTPKVPYSWYCSNTDANGNARELFRGNVTVSEVA